jgi:hypothetical protein
MSAASPPGVCIPNILARSPTFPGREGV